MMLTYPYLLILSPSLYPFPSNLPSSKTIIVKYLAKLTFTDLRFEAMGDVLR